MLDYAKFPHSQISESNKMRNKSIHKSDNGVRPIMPTSPDCCRPFTEKRIYTLCLQTLTLSLTTHNPNTPKSFSHKIFPYTRILSICETQALLECSQCWDDFAFSIASYLYLLKVCECIDLVGGELQYLTNFGWWGVAIFD